MPKKETQVEITAKEAGQVWSDEKLKRDAALDAIRWLESHQEDQINPKLKKRLKGEAANFGMS